MVTYGYIRLHTVTYGYIRLHAVTNLDEKVVEEGDGGGGDDEDRRMDVTRDDARHRRRDLQPSIVRDCNNCNNCNRRDLKSVGNRT